MRLGLYHEPLHRLGQTYDTYGPFARYVLEFARHFEQVTVFAPVTDQPTYFSGYSLDAPNIILDTVKAAEDGSGDIVLRMFESKRMATRCKLSGALKASRVQETNMLETEGRDLPLEACSVPLEFRPFEIKTLRVTLA